MTAGRAWDLSRRQTLAALCASTATLPLLASCGPSEAGSRDALTRLAQDIFPHPRVPASAYQGVAQGLLADPDAAKRKMVADGVADLDKRAGGEWASQPEPDRLKVLKEIAATPFFIAVRMATLFGLYANPAIVRTFGYPGPSVEFGGYLNNGYNDLSWLPEPNS